MRLQALLGTALSCAVVACTVAQAPQATPASSSFTPAGWTAITKHEVNDAVGVSKVATAFRIAIPPTWRETRQSADSIAAADRLLASANPAYARSAAEQQTRTAVRPPLTFIAIDTESPAVVGLVGANVYVTAQHIDEAIDADQMAASMWYYRQQTLDARLWSRSHVVLDGHDAVRLQMRYDLLGTTGERTSVASVHYIVVQGLDIFMLEFTGTFDRMDVLTPVFESIAATFKIL